MTALKEFTEDFVLLLEAGFVAVKRLDEDGAVKLFNAAQVLRKESTAPKIGLAAVALHKLETRKSVEILEGVLKQEPDNYRARALLGISYLLSNQKVEEGERMLKEAMEKSDDPSVQELGKLWLEVLEKGMRKSESPAVPKKPKGKK